MNSRFAAWCFTRGCRTVCGRKVSCHFVLLRHRHSVQVVFSLRFYNSGWLSPRCHFDRTESGWAGGTAPHCLGLVKLAAAMIIRALNFTGSTLGFLRSMNWASRSSLVMSVWRNSGSIAMGFCYSHTVKFVSISWEHGSTITFFELDSFVQYQPVARNITLVFQCRVTIYVKVFVTLARARNRRNLQTINTEKMCG